MGKILHIIRLQYKAFLDFIHYSCRLHHKKKKPVSSLCYTNYFGEKDNTIFLFVWVFFVKQLLETSFAL